MASFQPRGGGYGLDADLARKAAAKYDVNKEREAREWIEAVIGERLVGTTFADQLKDGTALCKLINAIQPGTVRRINQSKMPFKQMENISNFLRAIRALGVPEFELFETVDLFEAKDMNQVLVCIHSLGRTVQNTFNGPRLGPTQATSNPRQFTKEQQKKSALETGMTKLSMGSSQTMQRTHFVDTTTPAFGAQMASNNLPSSQNSSSTISKISQGSSQTMQRNQFVDSNSITFGANQTAGSNVPSASNNNNHQNIKQPPPPPPKPMKPNKPNRNISPPKTNTQSPPRTETYKYNPTTGQATLSSPAPNTNNNTSGTYISNPRTNIGNPTGTRGAGYGLDAELARKAAAKYDVNKEREAQDWIEAVTGERFSGSFADSLNDGVLLCKLINAIKPGSVRRINESKMAFKKMENISNFLKACRTVNVPESDLFETVDLYEQKDLGVVVQCIHALGRTIQVTVPNYHGPLLGPRMAKQNKRTFTEEQKRQARHNSALTKQTIGSSQTMQKTTYINSTDPTFGNQYAGNTIADDVVPAMGVGSSQVMQRSQIDRSNDITFGANQNK